MFEANEVTDQFCGVKVKCETDEPSANAPIVESETARDEPAEVEASRDLAELSETLLQIRLVQLGAPRRPRRSFGYPGIL